VRRPAPPAVPGCRFGYGAARRHPPPWAARLWEEPPCYHPAVEIMGVNIRTIISDNVAKRCDGCHEIIEGTPWRVNVLDIVTAETPVSWTARPAINPGPFQFHGDAAHVRRWMADRDLLFCRRGEVREIMRPIPIPAADGDAGQGRMGLCDGIHRDDHEFVPA
jgi:hypothetical protein